MATGRRFSQLSRAARDRAARIGSERYGLSRRQVRERYNRGTWNPYARGDQTLRIPREYRQYAQIDQAGEITVDWGRAAYANMRAAFGPDNTRGEREKWNDDAVDYKMRFVASDRMAQIIALASPAELEAWAEIQPTPGGFPDRESWRGLPPDITMDDIGYTRGSSWFSIFWYH